MAQWAKGQTGNPKGRPNSELGFREACRVPTPKLLARLLREVEEDGPEWLKATQLLLAYGHGKPPEFQGEQAGKQATITLNGVKEERLLELVKAGASVDPGQSKEG